MTVNLPLSDQYKPWLALFKKKNENTHTRHKYVKSMIETFPSPYGSKNQFQVLHSAKCGSANKGEISRKLRDLPWEG